MASHFSGFRSTLIINYSLSLIDAKYLFVPLSRCKLDGSKWYYSRHGGRISTKQWEEASWAVGRPDETKSGQEGISPCSRYLIREWNSGRSTINAEKEMCTLEVDFSSIERSYCCFSQSASDRTSSKRWQNCGNEGTWRLNRTSLDYLIELEGIIPRGSFWVLVAGSRGGRDW